jgi:uncharacterized protein
MQIPVTDCHFLFAGKSCCLKMSLFYNFETSASHTFVSFNKVKLKRIQKMKKLISWIDIPATDFKRAVNFYNNVLETNLEVFECGTEKMACFPTGEGSISCAPGFNPSPDGSLVSFNTGANIDAAIVRVEQNGGKIVTPKTKILVEGKGYFAVFIDTEGNKVGLYGDN